LVIPVASMTVVVVAVVMDARGPFSVAEIIWIIGGDAPSACMTDIFGSISAAEPVTTRMMSVLPWIRSIYAPILAPRMPMTPG